VISTYVGYQLLSSIRDVVQRKPNYIPGDELLRSLTFSFPRFCNIGLRPSVAISLCTSGICYLTTKKPNALNAIRSHPSSPPNAYPLSHAAACFTFPPSGGSSTKLGTSSTKNPGCSPTPWAVSNSASSPSASNSASNSASSTSSGTS